MDFLLYVIPSLVLGGVGVFVVGRFFFQQKSGHPQPFPFHVNLGEAEKLIVAALTGNHAMLKSAASKAVEIEWQGDSRVQFILSLALKEIDRKAHDPTSQAPVLDEIAKWTGLTRLEVDQIIQAELTPPAPKLPAAVAVVAGLLLLLTCGSAQAFPVGPSFASHFNRDVESPQQFYPTEINLVDPPLARNQYGQLVPSVSYPRYATGDTGIQGPDGYYYQDNCGYAANGFWRAGPVRRFFGNRQPMRRAGGFVGRIVSAPFRFLFRR